MRATRIYALSAVAVVAAAVVWSRSSAQPAAAVTPARVAVCDVVEVFNNYQRAKDLTTQLNERRQAIKAESEKRQKAIDTLRLELENYKKGSKQYDQTLNEMQRLSIEGKAYLEYQDAMALREHRNLTKDMYDEIKAMIARMAAQRGVDLVLQKDAGDLETENTQELLRRIYNHKVLYTADRLDITESVLVALNQAYQAKKPAAGTP